MSPTWPSGGPELPKKIVESYHAFVLRVATEFRNNGVPVEDLVGHGTVGLLEAARRFDPDRGYKFTTYAVWWIRKSILSAIPTYTRLIQIPEYQMKRLRELRDTRKSLVRALGREPTRSDLHGRLCWNPERAEAALQTRAPEISIDGAATAPADAGPLLRERLHDPLCPSPEDALLRSETTREVRRAMTLLPPQQRSVLRHRFGFARGFGMTLEETGSLLGLSGERVRQIERQALPRLRQILEHRMGQPEARSVTPQLRRRRGSTRAGASVLR